jgi:hypothetical protein
MYLMQKIQQRLGKMLMDRLQEQKTPWNHCKWRKMASVTNTVEQIGGYKFCKKENRGYKSNTVLRKRILHVPSVGLINKNNRPFQN